MGHSSINMTMDVYTEVTKTKEKKFLKNWKKFPQLKKSKRQRQKFTQPLPFLIFKSDPGSNPFQYIKTN